MKDLFDVYERLFEQFCQRDPYTYQFISGGKIAMSWIWNKQTDRVIAYHGPKEGLVGWRRGQPVIKLTAKQAIPFLDGEPDVDSHYKKKDEERYN